MSSTLLKSEPVVCEVTIDSTTLNMTATQQQKPTLYQLEIPEGTSNIHPNTGLRKSWSVGCTQSLEHSSGMWYDGREHPSGVLDDVDFEGDYYDDEFDACCGRENDHEHDEQMYMSYYGGQAYYADSEAVYSDEEGGSYDGEDDEDEDDVMYMRRPRRGANSNSDTEASSATSEEPKEVLELPKEHFDAGSFPIDAHALHGKLARLQIQSCT